MTDFVFLREADESNNDATARCAEQALADGPMASTLRVADYVAFLDAFAGRGKEIKGVATSCAMFGGATLIHAGVLPPRPPPKARAITTWLGLGGFSSPRWIPASLLPDGPRRGDVLYICSTAGRMSLGGGKFYTWTRWEAAANGHVLVLRDDGWSGRTAEGGGSPGGTGCRLSSGPKDLLRLGRTARGVWRPDPPPDGAKSWRDWLTSTRDTEPAPPPSVPPPPPQWTPIRRNDPRTEWVARWQLRLRAAGYELPRSFKRGQPDGDFGDETERATRECQRDHLMPQTGVVDRETWEACR